MLEKNLEECLNSAFKFAHENKHEFVTTEHLLLCILNNQDALNVLLACDVNVDILEAELKEFFEFDFFPRSGGGIGMTRLIRSMKKEGLMK